MTRPLRVNVEGGWYHVTARGIERRTIFTDKREQDHFYKCGFAEWSAYQPAQSLRIEVKETGIVVAR